MSFGGRIMTTVTGAVEGAVTAWNKYPHNTTPHRDVPYGDIALRNMRYRTAEGYYYNTIYSALDAMALELKLNERLYKFIRGIFNPVQTLIFLLTAYTYKGTIDTQTFRGGSTPFIYDNTALEDALRFVVKWSNLDQQLGKYVRDASLLGDAAWWIADEPARGRVRLELIDPGRIKYRELDAVGNIKAAVIEYQREEEPDVSRYQPGSGFFNTAMTLRANNTYTYTMIADGDSFKTYKDGKPFKYPFHTDENGNPVDGWDNIYGFVPLKMGYYEEGKDRWGQNAFFGVPRRQIDEINDATSLLSDSVRNVVTPLLQAYGMTRSSETALTRDDRDNVSILYMPNDKAELKPVTIPLDITAASNHRAGLIADLEKNLPVLALQRIREMGGNISGVAIQNMFGDATSCIENLRKNLDPVLCAALQMAVSIGGIQGYEGFRAFNEQSYDNGDMELAIADRPVIEDRMSRTEKVDKLASIASLPAGTKRQALAEMDYSKQVVDEIMAEDQAEAEEKARAAVRALADSAFGDEDDEDTEDDENAAIAEETELEKVA